MTQVAGLLLGGRWLLAGRRAVRPNRFCCWPNRFYCLPNCFCWWPPAGGGRRVPPLPPAGAAAPGDRVALWHVFFVPPSFAFLSFQPRGIASPENALLPTCAPLHPHAAHQPNGRLQLAGGLTCQPVAFTMQARSQHTTACGNLPRRLRAACRRGWQWSTAAMRPGAWMCCRRQ